jgi:hypothetical protein
MTTLTTIDYASDLWARIPQDHRAEIRDLHREFIGAPKSGVCAWLAALSEKHHIPYTTLRTKFYTHRNSRQDWTTLIDQRKLKTLASAQLSLTNQPRFIAYLLTLVEKNKRKNAPAFRELHRRWRVRDQIIPGYEKWQGWPSIPDGWSQRNLARIVQREANKARLTSIRIGTSSKTNTYLPTVRTTRTDLWPGAIIQLDDQWHDNYLTIGVGTKARAIRAIELGAQDVFSAHRFHWGCKPRLRRDNGTMQDLNGADSRLFLAGMFHRTGYSPMGTMLMAEHATMAVTEQIERILYDATGGLVRVERQPIEGKQAALCGYWNGTEGGNFRAKALLESTHNLIRNDAGSLPMQIGSFTSGIKGPVTTDRQLAYITRIIKAVAEKVPHRAELLRLPTWDFHSQFIPFLTDYYHFGLALRTDHELEGWETLGNITREWTLAPGSGQYITEETFLTLDPDHRAYIAKSAQADPSRWQRARKLSPLEVWEKRPKFQTIPSAVICEMIGRDMVREVVARRGFVEFSDNDISTEPLIYQARYCAGPDAGKEIHHGEKIGLFANPFEPDVAFVTDAAGRYLGELPLYKRVTPIDPAAFQTTAPFDARPDIRSTELTRAAGEKHARIADILEPSRIHHREEVAEARDLRAHNKRVINGDPITPEEIAQARTASAQQGVRTAAANRLQTHGNPIDWDAEPAAISTPSAWDQLPDDEEIPEAL